jgi:hypothetical protein
MIKEIPKSDVVIRPIKVYKEWQLDETNISPIFAISSSLGAFDDENDPKSQGISKLSLYNSIKAQFYTNAATASVLTEVGRRISYASNYERVLEDELAVFSIPQIYYGEGIKPETVTLIDETIGRTYTDDGYSNLIDSASNIKGNIFYDRGLVVVTKDVTDGSVLNNFTLQFRSTKTIFENEIFITVLENEFNFSQNPSAVYEDGGRKISTIINRPGNTKINDLVTSSFYDPGIKWVRNSRFPFTSSINPNKFASFDDYEYSSSIDPTGSYLAPYITTIGLYDNELNMVAVAKLPQPIKSLADYPINFIIRFDT